MEEFEIKSEKIPPNSEWSQTNGMGLVA